MRRKKTDQAVEESVAVETAVNDKEDDFKEKDPARQKSWKYIMDVNSVSKERLNRVALISTDRSYSYRQMFYNWNRYAEVFSSIGITEENHSRLAVFDCDCVESSFAFYAANMTGASAVGFTSLYLSEGVHIDRSIQKLGITDLFITDISVNVKRLERVLKLKKELGLRNIIVAPVNIQNDYINPDLVSFSRKNLKALRKIKGVLFMDDLLTTYEAEPIKYGEKENDPEAFILHTSGTTKGISKPVPLSDHGVNLAVESVKSSGKFDEFMEGSVSLCAMVVTSVYGFVNQLHLPLSIGCTVVVPPMGNLNPFLNKAIGLYKVNVLFATPFYFEAWSKMPPEMVPDFSSVKCVISGGAYLSAKARKRYHDFMKEHGGDPKFINGYGMSETCGACIIQSEEVEDDSIGYPLPGVNVKIYDEEENKFYSIKDRHTGVLYINSESISLGKIGDTQFFETEMIRGVPYISTYDLVRVNEDGALICQGRANRYFVNNDGIKFDAGIVENLVAAQEGIEACAVTPWYDKVLTHDTVPVLYVQTIKEDPSPVETVRKALIDVFIRQGTAKETNLPMQCVITSDIPYNSSGKVDINRIVTESVPGKRYIVRRINSGDELADIRLEYTNKADEGLDNGALPEELEKAWNSIRMSIMDDTVLNRANIAWRMGQISGMSQMSGMGQAAVTGVLQPLIISNAEQLKWCVSYIWGMEQQLADYTQKMLQNTYVYYSNRISGIHKRQISNLNWIIQSVQGIQSCTGTTPGQTYSGQIAKSLKTPQLPYLYQNMQQPGQKR